MTRAIESTEAAPLCLRRARFEDVSALLRLIEESIEHGCRHAYSEAQRRAVFLTYAECLFVDVVQPLDTIVIASGAGGLRPTVPIAGGMGPFQGPISDERQGRFLGMAQLDPTAGRLRALFVTPALQGRGLGRILLTAVERLARARGLRALEGAMSVNAVDFYRHAGFAARRGPEHLVRGGIVVPIIDMEKVLLENPTDDS
jgi:ribosomal protein S18 acetylase RimI-like enzyme